MPDQNEIGQVLFTAKKKKKPWKNGFYKMGDLCLGLARVSGMCLIYPLLFSSYYPIIILLSYFHRQIQHHFINDEGARSPTDVLPAEVP